MNIKLYAGMLFGLLLFGAAPLLAQPDANVDQKTEQQVVDLWPQGLPEGSVKLDEQTVKELLAKQAVHPRGHILYVDTPSLTVFPADKENANGCAVIVCPGGGYNILAWPVSYTHLTLPTILLV